MQINYCDICGQPIHSTRFVLFLVEEKNFGSPQQGKSSNETSYEICGDCVKTIHKIFSLKKNHLSQMTKILEDTYKLPVKKNKNKE